MQSMYLQELKMPVISSDSILDYKVPYNNKIARRYNEIPLIAIISSHIQENQKLISLRDWILPMLMNGRLPPRIKPLNYRLCHSWI